MAPHDQQDWEAAWDAAYPAPDDARPAPEPARPRRRAPRTRSVALATGMLVLGLAPFGVAATGDALREGERNGTANRETEIISRVTETGAAKGGYATRQSNLSNSGGGAVYGCRAGTGANTNPCLRATNLEGGLAFEFNAAKGEMGGTFTVGDGGDAKRPFTTNATGVATGLNADEVDGSSAADIVGAARAKDGLDADSVDGAGASGLRTRWVLVNAAGQIEAQSGGFTVSSGYQANPPGAAGNVYINAGENLTDNGLAATIALQNAVDQDGNGNMNGRQAGADQNAEFSGEISATRCAIPGVVTCAPPNTNNANHFVVSPRLSDGQVTSEGNRKRFYVTITE